MTQRLCDCVTQQESEPIYRPFLQSEAADKYYSMHCQLRRICGYFTESCHHTSVQIAKLTRHLFSFFCKKKLVVK